MRALLIVVSCVLLLAGLSGCGGSACDDACDKIKSCTGIAGQCTDDCSGRNECTADCTLAASCEDIKGSLSGSSNALTECVKKCQ